MAAQLDESYTSNMGENGGGCLNVRALLCDGDVEQSYEVEGDSRDMEASPLKNKKAMADLAARSVPKPLRHCLTVPRIRSPDVEAAIEQFGPLMWTQNARPVPFSCPPIMNGAKSVPHPASVVRHKPSMAALAHPPTRAPSCDCSPSPRARWDMSPLRSRQCSRASSRQDLSKTVPVLQYTAVSPRETIRVSVPPEIPQRVIPRVSSIVAPVMTPSSTPVNVQTLTPRPISPCPSSASLRALPPPPVAKTEPSPPMTLPAPPVVKAENIAVCMQSPRPLSPSPSLSSFTSLPPPVTRIEGFVAHTSRPISSSSLSSSWAALPPPPVARENLAASRRAPSPLPFSSARRLPSAHQRACSVPFSTSPTSPHTPSPSWGQITSPVVESVPVACGSRARTPSPMPCARSAQSSVGRRTVLLQPRVCQSSPVCQNPPESPSKAERHKEARELFAKLTQAARGGC